MSHRRQALGRLLGGLGLAGGAALAAGTALTGCAAPGTAIPAPTQPPPMPRVHQGDRWRYARIDLFRGQQVDELRLQAVEAAAIVRLAATTADGRPLPEEITGPAWSMIQEPAYDVVQTFERPMPVLPAMLVVGSSQSDAGSYRTPGSSARFPWRQRMVARRWERISVPAGQFDCLRVERIIHFDHYDLFRQDPMRFDTVWYAPRINRWVRREWTGEYWMPGSRRVRNREDWIAWELLDYLPAPMAG